MRQVQGTPGITNAQKRSLGITVRDEIKTPVPKPDTKPLIFITSTDIHRVRIRLKDTGAVKIRGKPKGVFGALIFTHIGTFPPADIKDWKFAGITTRTKYEVNFPSSAPSGSTAWFTARWLNTRAEQGPLANFKYAQIPGCIASSPSIIAHIPEAQKKAA